MKYKEQLKVLMVWNITLCFVLSSCSKYLDKKQDATQVVPSNLSDLQAMLDNGNQTTAVSPAYCESSSDEYYLTQDIYNSYPEIYQQIYTWEKFVVQDGGISDWRTCYTAVYYDNLVLDLLKNIDREDGNAAEWDNIKGSALFFRAYHFLNLLWEYAKAFDSTASDKDSGIALRLTSDFNVPSTRASVQQSYQQVINDAKESLPLLPDYPLVLTRPSKSATYGLLARCYLSMRDYKDALLCADSSLQLNNSLIDFNGDADIVGTVANDVPFKQFNKETIFYCEMSYNWDIYSYVSNIDTSIVSLYLPNDLRKSAYIGNNSGETYFKASYTGNTTPYFTGIATDEMYLTRAECYIREGQVQKGLDDINTLLSKRYKTGTYKPITGLSQTDALAKVLLERRKELLFRGSRWIDIKRLNKEGMNIVLRRNIGGRIFTLPSNDNFYALPLPDDVIKISGMPQN